MREALIRRLGLDPALLDASAEPENARNLNRDIVQRLSAAPDMWSFEPSLIRRLRLEGRGPFPLCAEDEQAGLVELDGPHGRIPLRVFKPSARVSRGTYLHFHGGGWTLGSAREYDRNSRALAEATGLTVLSADYRLGPEHPYPQGPDDCEAVARWLVSGASRYPTGFLAIGGGIGWRASGGRDTSAHAGPSFSVPLSRCQSGRRMLRPGGNAECARLGIREAHSQHKRHRNVRTELPGRWRISRFT